MERIKLPVAGVKEKGLIINNSKDWRSKLVIETNSELYSNSFLGRTKNKKISIKFGWANKTITKSKYKYCLTLVKGKRLNTRSRYF